MLFDTLDFTLFRYQKYLEAIRSNGFAFYRFDEFMLSQPKPERFCLIRHDVDRKPENALKMAELEFSMHIKSTYYFRVKQETFKPNIIQKVASLGHEVGYHYESLSDMNGNVSLAIEDFRNNLCRFKEYVEVKTISMHGRPFKPYDNRDLWRIPSNHKLLANNFDILGEVYLDIDYSDIAYINDTGRNWTSGESNKRDKVDSNVTADFRDGDELLGYLKNMPHPKMVFQVHPERWSGSVTDYLYNLAFDSAVNIVKKII